MIVHQTAVAALVVSTLFAANAFAQSDAPQPLAPIAVAAHPALVPGAGRVPLRIEVTQPRRVMLRSPARHGALEYVCTTPCRVYVAPGAVDVVLVGWGASAYHWDVPEHGGSVRLLARLPGGRLSDMPASEAAAIASSRAHATVAELKKRPAAAVR